MRRQDGISCTLVILVGKMSWSSQQLKHVNIRWQATYVTS